MVTVFGLGFVGLTTALGFAHMGYKVYGIDVDTERKNTLRAGRLPFMEPHMEEQLKKHLGQNFFIVDEVEKAVADSSYVFYCVGTPYGQEGSADLSYLLAAVDETVAAVSDDKFRVLVIKSTVPPSTTAEKIYPYVQSKGVISQQFGVANNPEFLREGHCWEDFIGADRIVLGCSDKRSKEMLEELFEGKTPLVIELKVERGNANALTDAVMAALEGWNGIFCLESFHPAALLRLKEKYPQVLRGQLSQNFLKPGEANGLSLPVRFMLTNLLTTAATRPDFIAYSCKDRNNASLRMMKALYGVHEVGWTVRDRETMDALDREGTASIFEGFVP